MKERIKDTINKIICVVLYIRVSTEEQAKHGYSIDSQIARLKEYCKEKGYKIVGIYIDEGKSARAKLKNRKELLKLIEDAKEEKFDRVVFWRLDRWFRNIADYYRIQEVLDAHKISWECSDEEYDTYTSNGRLYLNIKLSIAQNESDQTGDRIRFNFENMVKNGKAITGSHAVPLGYMVSGEEKNKKVVKNPDTEQMAIDMLNYVRKCGSIRGTVLYINEKYNKTICYDSMRHYLTNTKYYGYYRGNDNYCEAYITKEEFDYIQSLIKQNVRHNKRYDYIFSSLIRCPLCGSKLSGITTKCKNGTFKYAGYRCNHAYNDNLCTYRKKISENVLEEYLLSNLKQEITKHIYSIQKIEDSNENLEKKYDIDKIKKKLSKLTDLYMNDKILREKYDEEFEKLNNQLKEASLPKERKSRNLNKYKDLIDSNMLEVYNKLNNNSKRMFWAKYIDYIEKDMDDEYHIYFK